MNTEDRKIFNYTNLRLTDDYHYDSENEENQHKPTEADAQEFNKFIIKEETDIDKKIFKNSFGFYTPSALLKNLYNLNYETENNESVSVIKSRLSDFENKIEKMT